MIKRVLAFTAAIALPAAGMAQTVTGVKVEPAELKVGETAKVTVDFTVTAGINCGLRLYFGDGAGVDYKINQDKDVPLVVPHVYSKPGELTLMAEPKTVGTLLKCGGKSQYAKVKVAAANGTSPKAGAKAKSGDVAASPCPEGWTLDKKSVRKKTGAFTCQAAPGTRPKDRLSCPGDLSYFENVRKGVIGCRP